MAFLIDDDFQSYAIGAIPPFGNLYQVSVINPFISVDVPGIFGDTKSVTMPSIQGLIWPTQTPNASLPAYTNLSLFMGLWISPQTDQFGTLCTFYDFINPFAGGNMGHLDVNSDGTLLFGVDGGNFLVSDFSMLTEKWYFIQCNVQYSTVAGKVCVQVDVVVNGQTVLSGFLTSNRNASDFTVLYVNTIILGGCSGGSRLGRLTLSDTILTAGTVPHPAAAPTAFVSQGVIELIKSVSGVPLSIPACIVGTATLGTFYSQTFSAVGGVAPYTWSIIAGAFPDGLSINPATGEVSGTPITAGPFSYTVQVTDFLGNTSTIDCTITVSGLSLCAERFGPKLYFWEPSYLDRPEDTEMRATDWENAGLVGAKFCQGFTLHADTQGVNKQITIQGDGASIQTYTINHNGEVVKPYVFKPAAVASLLRVISPDTIDWRFFGIKYVWEPLPESVTYYKTQGTTHDIPGYQFLKDGYIALISTADVTLTINVDGTDFVYNIPSTGGVFKKNYLIFGINGTTGQTLKGKLYTYELRSTDSTKGFRLFQKDSEVFVHAWGGGPYTSKQPFGGTSRLYGARI